MHITVYVSGALTFVYVNNHNKTSSLAVLVVFLQNVLLYSCLVQGVVHVMASFIEMKCL